MARDIIHYFIFAPAVYVLTVMWWIPEGEKYVPGIVIISLLARLFTTAKKENGLLRFSVENSKEYLFLIFATWLVVVYGAFVYFWNGDSWTELRALLAMAIYVLAIRGLLVTERLFKGLLVLSGVGFFLLTWGLYATGYSRVGGFINPIPYATALGAVLVMVFVVALFDRGEKNKVAFYVLGVGLLSALFMTQTRGVILPVLALMFSLLSIRILGSKRKWKGIFALIGVAIAFSGFGVMISGDRISQTAVELESIAEGDHSGSIGLRLQMWVSAIEIWRHSPIVGNGNAHADVLAEMYKAGDVSQELFEFSPSHYHNQYLDFLVKKGAFGLFIWLLFLVAFVIYVSRSGAGPVVWGGLSIIALYVLAGLTDVPFRHPASIYMFFSLLLISVAGLSRKSSF